MLKPQNKEYMSVAKLTLPKRKAQELVVENFFLDEDQDLVILFEDGGGNTIELVIPSFNAHEIADMIQSER